MYLDAGTDNEQYLNDPLYLGLRKTRPPTAELFSFVDEFVEAVQEKTSKRVPLQWPKSTGDQGVALMLLAERRRDAKMTKLAGRQIEAAFATSRAAAMRFGCRI